MDRIAPAPTDRPTPTPPPGRLPVDYFTDAGDATKPLNELADRTYVAVSGTITNVTDTTIVVTGADGNSAFCMLDADTRRDYAASLVVGTQVLARGLVRQLPDGQRVIDAKAVHNLDRKAVLL